MKQRYNFKDRSQSPGPVYNYDINAIKKSSAKWSYPSVQKKVVEMKVDWPLYDVNTKFKKAAPKFGFGTAKRAEFNKTMDLPGPAHYKIPCSIKDVPYFIRKNDKFQFKEFAFI